MTRPTRRDVVVSLLTTALVLGATYYGGPLAGKVVKTKVSPVAPVAFDSRDGEVAVMCIASSYEPPKITTWRVGTPPKPERVMNEPCRECCAPTRAALDRLEALANRCVKHDDLDAAYHRALLREGVFPVTTHEARP